MTELYETKRKFVEEQLAPLLHEINPYILELVYKKSDFLEKVHIRSVNDACEVNVTGDSNMYILIDVMTALFGRKMDNTVQTEDLKRRVERVEQKITQLAAESAKVAGEMAECVDAILQSIAQNDGDEEDKPDET